MYQSTGRLPVPGCTNTHGLYSKAHQWPTWQSVVRSFVIPGLPTLLVQKVNVSTVTNVTKIAFCFALRPRIVLVFAVLRIELDKLVWPGISKMAATRVSVVPRSEVRSFINRCMVSVGANPDHADIMAELLMTADYRGHYSHGINRLGKLITHNAAK